MPETGPKPRDPRRLSIVQIVETLALGGLETMALELALAHRAAGHRSAIYTVFEAGALAEKARDAGVSVVAFQKRRGFSAAGLLRLVRRLRQDEADIVHTHNSAIHHYGAVAGKLAGCRVVSTRHGLALHSAPRQEVQFQSVLPLTDAVVFVCEYGKRHYAKKGSAPERKSHVVLNGVALERFQRRRAAPGALRPRLRFGTIGRFVEAKAHGDLLEAFAAIAGEFPEAELSIWGYGALRDALERRIVDLGLAARVRCPGAAVKAEEALSAMDVFVLSSISEGLPLVILEAMASGLPIVSTAVGGVPEVVAAPFGWLADPGNPSSLADAMRRAARADLPAAGEAAYEYAAGRFGVVEMQAAYEAIYRGLLRR